MDIPVELSRIVINEQSDSQLIVLKERDGERSIPIVIGIVEIFAIDRRLKGIEPPRPMTHDLLANIIEALDAEIDRIVINDLRDHTFFAQIHLRHNGDIITVDSRPSDAIAVGVANEAPIYVADHVLDETLD